MRFCRILAAGLAAATALSVLLGYSQQLIDPLTVALMGAGVVVLLAAAAAPVRRTMLRRLLGVAIGLYTCCVLAALGMEASSESPLPTRAGLVAALLGGLALGLYWGFISRTKPTRGFHNYYDR